MRTLAHTAIIGLICYLLYRAMQQHTAAATGGVVAGNGGGAGGMIEDIMQAIFNHEGAGPRDSLNNPGNLHAPSDSYWNGQTGRSGSEAIFGDIGDGWDALRTDIRTWSSKNPDGDFYDFFNHYAPGNTGNSFADAGAGDAYADAVADYLGVDATTPVSKVV